MKPLPRPLIYFLLYFALIALKLVTYSFTVPRCRCPHVVIRLFIENYYVLTLAAYFPHAACNIFFFLENLKANFLQVYRLTVVVCNEPRNTGKKCLTLFTNMNKERLNAFLITSKSACVTNLYRLDTFRQTGRSRLFINIFCCSP